MSRLKTTAVCLVLLFLGTACGGPAFVRGSDNPDLDKYAMSTGLDKKDLKTLFDQNSDSLSKSRQMTKWKDLSMEDKAATVAILPIKNDTSEHIDPQLQALLSDFETQLVNDGVVNVVSYESQRRLVNEISKQQSAAFDPDKVARLGKQLGVKYFITGKIYDAAEKVGSERRVPYILFMQALDVETGQIRWQNKANLTKGFIN